MEKRILYTNNIVELKSNVITTDECNFLHEGQPKAI